VIITDLWSRMPGAFFCISTKSSTGKWRDHYFARNELDKVRAFLRENNDKDCYFCPHGLKRRSRKEEDAEPGNILWADLDEADPRTMNPKPTIAIESSPGRYAGLWLIDKPFSKELNRGLTYHVGADKGGWDVGQVLRVPGTINYKYNSHPRVRVLWDNHSPTTYAKVETIVKANGAKHPASKVSSISALQASDVFRQYEKRLPHWCRRELIRKEVPKSGKRSEMIWKLEHALLEAGCDQDEAFVLIKSSVWNKFRGRQNEDEQLRRELDKIVESRLSATTEPASDMREYKFLATSLREVEEKNIDWLWYGRLALGELTILEGDPGLGKSYFMQVVARHICDGIDLPDMRKDDLLAEARVAYFDIENDPGAVTKRRLSDNDIMNQQNFFPEEMAFSIDDPDALDGVEDAIERLRPKLVVFDTLNNYIGSADIHKSSEAQQAMMWFRDVARRFHCAVVVLRHLTKGGKDKALYRGQGSIAFAGAARIIMTIGQHPDDAEQRVCAVTKMNLARLPKALAFRIDALPDSRERKDRSRFEFTGVVDYTAEDILSSNKPDNSGSEKEQEAAEAFLLEVLDEGQIEARKIEIMAEKRGIAKRTLQRAADALSVEKIKKGFGKKAASWWALPEPS